MINYRKLKPFIISLVLVFIMVLLQNLGIKPPQFLSRVCLPILRGNCGLTLISPVNKISDPMDNLRPRLEARPLKFELKKPISIIQKALASGEYEQAAGYGVIDFETGEVLMDKNISTKLPIASLTKIMSAVITLDLARPEELVTISENPPKQIPTRLVLTPGEKLSFEELINAALLTSANDCTEALKEGIDAKYGSPVFIKAMNEKARILGLKNTHFTNPQGFDNPEHYSTIEDLAILTQYALKNYPLIAEIAAKDHEVLLENSTHKEFYLNNWQALIGVYPGVQGLKIGNTGDAGHTTSVVSEREGHKLIAIVLGAPGVIERDLWAAGLLDSAFKQEFNLTPIEVTRAALQEKYATFKYFR